jgi:hypothetical protein
MTLFNTICRVEFEIEDKIEDEMGELLETTSATVVGH